MAASLIISSLLLSLDQASQFVNAQQAESEQEQTESDPCPPGFRLSGMCEEEEQPQVQGLARDPCPQGYALGTSGICGSVELENGEGQNLTASLEEESEVVPSVEFVTQGGHNKSASGNFDDPIDVATDSSGNVYVSDSGNYRIQKLSPTGEFLTMWGSRGDGPGELNGKKELP